MSITLVLKYKGRDLMLSRVNARISSSVVIREYDRFRFGNGDGTYFDLVPVETIHKMVPLDVDAAPTTFITIKPASMEELTDQECANLVRYGFK